MPEAIRAALAKAGPDATADGVTAGLVREHARGLALERLGEVGYREHVAEILGQAEEMMALLETLPGEPRVVLVGRAARGQVDADPCCRLRVESDLDLAEIAARIVEAGYDEPSFGTVETRFGRLARLTLVDQGVEHRILRCPPAMRIPLDGDLREHGTVPTLDHAALSRLIAGLQG